MSCKEAIVAGKKKVVPRQSRVVEGRGKQPVRPKWLKVDALDKTIVDVNAFRNPDGSWKTSELYQAHQKYGANKKYGMELEGEGVVFRPSQVHKTPEGGIKAENAKLLSDWGRANGKRSDFYSVPTHDPKEGNWAQIAKMREGRKQTIKTLVKAQKGGPTRRVEIKPHPTLPHVKIKEIFDVTGKNPKLVDRVVMGQGNRILKSEGEARDYSRGMALEKEIADTKDPNTKARLRREREHELIRNRAELAQAKKDLRSPKQPKPKEQTKQVVKRRFGEDVVRPYTRYKEGMKLTASQHRASSGIVYNISARRRAQMEVNATKRDARARKREAEKERLRGIRMIERTKRHERAVANRRQREKVREPGRRRARQAAMQAKLVNQIRNMTRFLGRGVPKLQLKGQQWATGRRFGRALKSLPHSERYPTFGHGQPTQMKRPVSMAPVSGKLSLASPRYDGVSGVRGTTVFATAQTLSGRSGSGSGIFFRIDAEAVITNLIVRYPQAMAAAAETAAKTVGDKLLNIVEPYVPKDTGLMYTTAQTNSAQTSGGLVDIEGAEAYPSSQMFGVSISYNTPYAEDVYFDETKRHGAEYNSYYGTSEKGEKETYRWIEAAFKDSAVSVQGLLGDYARIITSSLNAAGMRQVNFKSKRGTVSFIAKR